MKKVLILSLVATLGGSSLALAHGNGGARFARVDKDGDGRVTQQELLAHKLARFDAADANRDGKLTDAERQAARSHKAEARFQKKDGNGDGVLSTDELGRMPAKRFEALDSDKSGGLSLAELKAGKGHGRHAKRGEGRGKARGPKAKGDRDRAGIEAHVAKRFAKLDKNGDQALTQDELGRRGRGRRHGKGHGKQRSKSDRDAG